MTTAERIQVDAQPTVEGLASPMSPVGGLVWRPAIEVDRSAPLHRAAEVMAEAGIAALVVDGGEAILSERDLTRAVAAGALDDDVERWATPHPVVVPADTPVNRAAAVMLNTPARHLIVRMEDGGIGVVSLRDVVGVLLQVSEPEQWLKELRISVEQAPEMWIG